MRLPSRLNATLETPRVLYPRCARSSTARNVTSKILSFICDAKTRLGYPLAHQSPLTQPALEFEPGSVTVSALVDHVAQPRTLTIWFPFGRLSAVAVSPFASLSPGFLTSPLPEGSRVLHLSLCLLLVLETGMNAR